MLKTHFKGREVLRDILLIDLINENISSNSSIPQYKKIVIVALEKKFGVISIQNIFLIDIKQR